MIAKDYDSYGKKLDEVINNMSPLELNSYISAIQYLSNSTSDDGIFGLKDRDMSVKDKLKVGVLYKKLENANSEQERNVIQNKIDELEIDVVNPEIYNKVKKALIEVAQDNTQSTINYAAKGSKLIKKKI